MNKNKILLSILLIIACSYTQAEELSGFEAKEGKTKTEKLVNYVNFGYPICRVTMAINLEIARLNPEAPREDAACIAEIKSELQRAYKIISPSLKKKPAQQMEFKNYTATAISSFEGLAFRMSDNTRIYDQRTSSAGEELKKAGTSLLLDDE